MYSILIKMTGFSPFLWYISGILCLYKSSHITIDYLKRITLQSPYNSHRKMMSITILIPSMRKLKPSCLTSQLKLLSHSVLTPLWCLQPYLFSGLQYFPHESCASSKGQSWSYPCRTHAFFIMWFLSVSVYAGKTSVRISDWFFNKPHGSIRVRIYYFILNSTSFGY